MKNENIGTNITNETIYSTKVHEEENVSSEVLTNNQIDATMSASDIQSGEAELILMQPLDETANVATASVECCDDCCEDKASTAEMDNAVHLTLNEWRNDTITSSISERWYKFSTNEADTYTIYTSGSTDTIGRLYDENGDRVTLNDDRAGSLNFRIVYPLDANSTYYVKVTTPQNLTGEFSIRVVKRVLPALSKYNLTLNVGEEDSIQITTSSNSATDIYVKYSSSDPDSVSVNSDTGDVTAVGTGISVITATDIIHNDVIGECEVWVKGKTPVILIHGRTDNTFDVWGASSAICNFDASYNNHYNCKLDATTTSTSNPVRYIDVSGQEITTICRESVEDGNLAYYLTTSDDQGNSRGYEANVNLFAFNYPNEDAVKHSAIKLKKYIENLTDYVRTSGSNKMKACFYASRIDYVNDNYKVNIVAHSMGGLVSRYYIENLECDNRVDKLITVCTPHWGSGFAGIGCITGEVHIETFWGDFYAPHVLCDHDLRDSANIYGGTQLTSISCSVISGEKCPQEYILTNELRYDAHRHTLYYAIAGVSHNEWDVDDDCQLIPNLKNCTTYDSLEEAIKKENISFDVRDEDDNLVSFLSQIGWTDDDDVDTPNKRIDCEGIYLFVDADGGNSWWSILHNKIPHRNEVMEKIYDILNS